MKMIMKRLYLIVLLGVGFAAVPAWTMTQEEVDAVVDRKILRYVHPDVAKGAVRHLESKGATRQMLAEAFAKVLRRDMNADSDEDAFFKANAAIYWLSQYAKESDITNFVEVAREATNSLAATAWHYFSLKTSQRSAVVQEGSRLLERKDMNQLHMFIWDQLAKEARGELKPAIVAIAEKHLQETGVDVFYADEILVKHCPGYAKSRRRLSALRSALQMKRGNSLTSIMRRTMEEAVRGLEQK